MLEKATDDDSQILGHLLNVARKVAAQENLEKGFLVLVKILENFWLKKSTLRVFNPREIFIPKKYLTLKKFSTLKILFLFLNEPKWKKIALEP